MHYRQYNYHGAGLLPLGPYSYRPYYLCRTYRLHKCGRTVHIAATPSTPKYNMGHTHKHTHREHTQKAHKQKKAHSNQSGSVHTSRTDKHYSNYKFYGMYSLLHDC